jgi:hypothetical protein
MHVHGDALQPHAVSRDIAVGTPGNATYAMLDICLASPLAFVGDHRMIAG